MTGSLPVRRTGAVEGDRTEKAVEEELTRAGGGHVEDTNILSFIYAGLPRSTRRWWPPLLGIFEHLSANNKG